MLTLFRVLFAPYAAALAPAFLGGPFPIDLERLADDWERLQSFADDWYEGTMIDEPCPPEMVDMGTYCIDRYPWEDPETGEPLLGVSAIREQYLPGGTPWDCESLCGSFGKRLCTVQEWSEACAGTPTERCGPKRQWLPPDWAKVMRRSRREMSRLDQHAHADDYPDCTSQRGVRMMTTLEEWVLDGKGYAFSRGFWAREGGCSSINRAHAPNWHGYATACRCCMEPEL